VHIPNHPGHLSLLSLRGIGSIPVYLDDGTRLPVSSLSSGGNTVLTWQVIFCGELLKPFNFRKAFYTTRDTLQWQVQKTETMQEFACPSGVSYIV